MNEYYINNDTTRKYNFCVKHPYIDLTQNQSIEENLVSVCEYKIQYTGAKQNSCLINYDKKGCLIGFTLNNCKIKKSVFGERPFNGDYELLFDNNGEKNLVKVKQQLHKLIHIIKSKTTQVSDLSNATNTDEQVNTFIENSLGIHQHVCKLPFSTHYYERPARMLRQQEKLPEKYIDAFIWKVPGNDNDDSVLEIEELEGKNCRAVVVFKCIAIRQDKIQLAIVSIAVLDFFDKNKEINDLKERLKQTANNQFNCGVDENDGILLSSHINFTI